jgi:hypothetical protein
MVTMYSVVLALAHLDAGGFHSPCGCGCIEALLVTRPENFVVIEEIEGRVGIYCVIPDLPDSSVADGDGDDTFLIARRSGEAEGDDLGALNHVTPTSAIHNDPLSGDEYGWARCPAHGFSPGLWWRETDVSITKGGLRTRLLSGSVA